MIYTPPNYIELYEQQKDETDSWRNEALLLRSNLRDEFAMAALPAVMARYSQAGYTGGGAVAEAYYIAELMLQYKKANPCG